MHAHRKRSHKNGFLSNEMSVFDGSQPTFPKYLQKAGYQTAIFGKWHLETLPTGFDRWEILPGQGDYYNPRFIRQEGDTVTEHGYLTTLITDKSLNWLENERDKNKPFALLIHHKAIHRDWIADTCDLALFEDTNFPVPETFYDDYAGRPAAAAQEMSIGKDLDIIYDLKMLNDTVNTRLKGAYLSIIGRMDSAQRAAFDAHYQPIIDDFYKNRRTGKRTRRMEIPEIYARLHEGCQEP